MTVSIEKLRSAVLDGMQEHIDVFNKYGNVKDFGDLFVEREANEVLNLQIGETSEEFEGFDSGDESSIALSFRRLCAQAGVPVFVFESGDAEEKMVYHITRVSEDEYRVDRKLEFTQGSDDEFISFYAKTTEDLLYYRGDFLYDLAEDKEILGELLEIMADDMSFDEIVEFCKQSDAEDLVREILAEDPEIEGLDLLIRVFSEIDFDEDEVEDYADKLFNIKHFEDNELDYEESFSFTVTV